MPYFNITTAGEFSVVAIDSFGNQRFSDTVYITIDSFPVQAGFNTDTSLCTGSILPLTYGADQVVSYLWEDGSTNSFVEIDDERKYSVITRNSFACYSYDTIMVDTVGIAPTANFSNNIVCFGNTTSFSDLSIVGDESPIVEWNWNFGDGGLSNNQEPQYVFETSYLNDVILNVVAENGCENSLTQNVSVYKLPVVDFKPEIACSGDVVQFVDLSFSEESDIIHRIWSLLDTTIFDENSIEYTFTEDGVYPVNLIIENENSCTNELTKDVIIKPGVTADFNYSPACYNESIYFEDLSESLLGLEVFWNWDFGDNNVSEANNPAHRYDTTGIYEVHLVVQQTSNGCSDTVVKQITVFDKPVAVVPEFIACENAVFTYSDSSYVSNGEITDWLWSIENSGNYNTETPQVYFPNTGTYSTSLIVKTDANCKDTVQTITTVFPKPNARFSFSPSPGISGMEVEFDNNTEGAQSYLWYFDDGEESELFNPIHVYQDTGTYTIILNSYSEYECLHDTSGTINILEAIYNVAMLEIQLTVVNDQVIVNVEVANLGSVSIDNLELVVNYENGGAFSETISKTISAYSLFEHTFSTNIKLKQSSDPGYVCVEAFLPQLMTDGQPENNVKCISLGNEFYAYDPFPNPGQDNLSILFNLLYEGETEVYLINSQGDRLQTIFSGDAQQGLNRIDFDISELPNGIYSYVIYTRGQSLTKRFVKL